MREITLEAEKRSATGKRNRAIRRVGMVPGIYYLRGEGNISLAVPEKHLKPLIYTTETHIINLKLGDAQARNCILRAVQFDPVTEKPVHFDLQGLREDEKITVEVPVTIVGGTAAGVRDGGVLQLFIHRLKVSCLPRHIPEHVEISVENLKINQFVHVRDLTIENIVIVEHESSTIVGIVPPTVEKEEVAPVAAEAAEPEVIGKGKKPEEGAEAPATEKKAEATPAAATAPKKEEKK